MPPRVYTPTTAARVIGIAPNTVRAWCSRYSAHLSPSANPTSGEARVLTPSDVATLQAIKRLLDADVLPDEIEEQLSQLPPVELQQPDIPPDAVQQPPSSLPSSATAQESPGTAIALAQVQTVLQPAFDAMAARLSSVEQAQRDMAEQQRDSRRSFYFGVLAGVLAVGVAVIVLVAILRLGQ